MYFVRLFCGLKYAFIHTFLLSTNVLQAAPVCSVPATGVELVEQDASSSEGF